METIYILRNVGTKSKNTSLIGTAVKASQKAAVFQYWKNSGVLN
jgi:hypothetical protein